MCNLVTFCRKQNFKVILTKLTPCYLLNRKWEVKVTIKWNAGQSAMHLLVSISNRSAQPFLRYEMTSKTGSGPTGADDLGGRVPKNNRCRPLTISYLMWKFKVDSCSIFWDNRCERMLTDKQTNKRNRSTYLRKIEDFRQVIKMSGLKAYLTARSDRARQDGL